jgi:hypothetical protein
VPAQTDAVQDSGGCLLCQPLLWALDRGQSRMNVRRGLNALSVSKLLESIESFGFKGGDLIRGGTANVDA